ncbi:MAG: hypothetical protein RLZZ226_1975, partial [Pseudomonadota bacterium]
NHQNRLPGHWKTLPESTRTISFRPEGKDPEDHPAIRLAYNLPGSPTAKSGDLTYGVTHPLSALNATEYDHLVFWVKADNPDNHPGELEIRFQRPDPRLPGKQEVARFKVSGITAEWERMVIPLNQMIGIDQWDQLDALVIALPVQSLHTAKGSYTLGSIELIRTGQPGPSRNDPLVPEHRVAWAASLGGEAAVKTQLRARLAGWPTRFLVDRSSLPKDDREFLSRLAADTWRGVEAMVDLRHGLPIDRIQFGKDSLAPEQAAIGDYTNITNVGVYLLGIVSAHELGLVNRAVALEKLTKTLDTMAGLETHQGFFYNYYNTTTLERGNHFVSFVDSAWFTASLMVVRQAFPEMAQRCTRLIAPGHFREFYDPETRLMSHGYHANLGQRSNMHYGVIFTESRLGSLIAIGQGDVPAEHWFSMARTFPPEWNWQSQQPKLRTEQTAQGHHWMGGYYQWRDYLYVPSWGGSLFEALMPVLVLDELQYAPKGLGYNDRIHTAIHRQYALEDLSYPVWGMSPSSTPGTAADYGEYGVKFLGAGGYRSGVVTPHVSALALMTEPAEATANLRTLAERYPLYGDFGLYDAVNPGTGEVAYSYLILDQAMTLIALTNHLKDHAIQRYFAADPWIKRILPLLAVERLEPG